MKKKTWMTGVPSMNISMMHIAKKASNNPNIFPIEGNNGVDYFIDGERIMLVNTRGYIMIPLKKLDVVLEELREIKEVYIDE